MTEPSPGGWPASMYEQHAPVPAPAARPYPSTALGQRVPPGYAAGPRPGGPLPPSIAPVIIFSVFFGLLAAFSASNRARRAQTIGASGQPYWMAFWVVNGASFVLTAMSCMTGAMLGTY